MVEISKQVQPSPIATDARAELATSAASTRAEEGHSNRDPIDESVITGFVHAERVGDFSDLNIAALSIRHANDGHISAMDPARFIQSRRGIQHDWFEWGSLRLRGARDR